MKKVSIIGSTGSVGTQSLDVIRNMENIEVIGLSTNVNIKLLCNQILEFKPRLVSVKGNSEKKELEKLLKTFDYRDVDIFVGEEGLIKIAEDESELLITAVVGTIGMIPTIEAIRKNKTIALANKETLVAGGSIIREELKKSKAIIVPVDSEHSAIFQCLNGEKHEEIEKIILTASGGPFRNKKINDLKNVTIKETINHPNWSMGKKISVDSSTMVNKGLEVIEAKWLFDIDIEKIEVIVHPQSIVHSMVEYIDGSVIAQLSDPDMKLPIQYALTYPKRSKNIISKLKLSEIGSLTFEKPDIKTFRGLKLAIDAGNIGGTMPAVFNGANEELVSLFLADKIKYLDIVSGIEDTMNKHNVSYENSLETILNADKWSREYILKKYN